MSKTKVKAKLICYFVIKGIIHFKFISPKQLVKQEFYLQNMEHLSKHICLKQGLIFAG
jgi:hypothetical protein